MLKLTYKFPHHPEWDCVDEAENFLFSADNKAEIDAVEVASLINSKIVKICSHPRPPFVDTTDFKQWATITSLNSLTVTFT